MGIRKIDDRIEFLKNEAIKKVFHRREAKLRPEDFLPAAVKDNSAGFDTVAMPKDGKYKLKIEKYVEIYHSNGLRLGRFDCFEKAQYLIYSITKDKYMVAIPKDKSIVKLVLRRYEKYWAKKTEKLADYFMSQNANKKMALVMAEQVICEMKVPKKWNQMQEMILKQKCELAALVREFERRTDLKFEI